MTGLQIAEKRFESESPEATEAIAARLAAQLGGGDCIALHGGLGAGKSLMARAIIRTVLHDPDHEVPSPTYTLVNVYEAAGFEIWHADLYRIADADELNEIGLDQALEHALVLIEWPERWPGGLPAQRLDVHIEGSGEARQIVFAPRGGWQGHGAWET